MLRGRDERRRPAAIDAVRRRPAGVDTAPRLPLARPPGLTGLGQLLGAGSPADATLVLDRVYIVRRSLRPRPPLIALSFAVNVLGKRRVRELVRHVTPPRT